MPDVGLFTASEPVPKRTPVIIKFAVEVGGLPVYQESYDVATLAKELEQDEARATALWVRRMKCAVAAMNRPGFSAALTRCLMDGVSTDYGMAEENAVQTDTRGISSQA